MKKTKMKKHHECCQCYDCNEKAKIKEYKAIHKEAERIAKDDTAFKELGDRISKRSNYYQSWMSVAEDRIYHDAMMTRCGGYEKIFKKYGKALLFRDILKANEVRTPTFYDRLINKLKNIFKWKNTK